MFSYLMFVSRVLARRPDSVNLTKLIKELKILNPICSCTGFLTENARNVVKLNFKWKELIDAAGYRIATISFHHFWN